MRIGLDGQKLLVDKLAGPEVYTFNTFKSFAELDKNNQYIVYFDSTPNNQFWNELSQNNPNFSYTVVPKKLSWTQIGLALELIKNPVDIFFNAKHSIPGIVSLLRKTTFVSMIHGLEFRSNRQFFRNPLKSLVHPFVLGWVCAFSKIIVAPSRATKEAVLEQVVPKVSEEKIRIIHEGVDASFYKRPKNEIDDMRAKYELGDSDYLLFVSTIQPRKNISNMVAGFALALEEEPKLKNTKLVISGKLGWLYQDALDAPKKHDVEEQVKFVGRTPDEDLPKLLSGAKAFISCSLEEGFGLPLLQAMATETPTIVSDIPAFMELGRETPTFVKPESVDSIKNGILRSFGQNNSHDVKQAKQRAKQYSWEKGGRQLISLFESLIKNV